MLGFRKANTLSHRLQILATIFSDLDPKTKTLDFKQTITYHYLLREKGKNGIFMYKNCTHKSSTNLLNNSLHLCDQIFYFYFFLFDNSIGGEGSVLEIPKYQKVSFKI